MTCKKLPTFTRPLPDTKKNRHASSVKIWTDKFSNIVRLKYFKPLNSDPKKPFARLKKSDQEQDKIIRNCVIGKQFKRRKKRKYHYREGDEAR